MSNTIDGASSIYSDYRDVVGTTSSNYDVVFGNPEDNSTLSSDDFMNLFVTQLQNQDFTEPMDNSAMMEQITQLSNMEMMQEMAMYSKMNYVMTMVGKTVTATRMSVSGELEETTGVVDKVSIVEDEYVVHIGDKMYYLEEISEIGITAAPETEEPEAPQTEEGETSEGEDDTTVDSTQTGGETDG